MKISVVVLLCHSIVNISTPICREVVIVSQEVPIAPACVVSQAALAEWKERSIYAGEQWTIANIKCVKGAYAIKEAI